MFLHEKNFRRRRRSSVSVFSTDVVKRDKDKKKKGLKAKVSRRVKSLSLVFKSKRNANEKVLGSR